VRVAVAGGGLAGLSAGCELAELGHQVTVFEKRPFAGGKTYSFVDRESGEEVDNGQHVFMGCTTEYVAFLRRLGTLGLTRRQQRLSVPVFDANGRNRSVLRAMPLPSPLHLAWSFARFRHLSLADRARAGLLLARIWRMSAAAREALDNVSFGEWLRGHGQSAAAIRGFWDFTLVPTLNCRSDEASAAAALFVLQEGFLASSRSAAIGLPAVGLSELHVRPAVDFITKRGGTVLTGSTIAAVTEAGGRATGVSLADGAVEPFDAVVLAVPHTQVAGLLPPSLAGQAPFDSLAAIPTAPIINLHLWYDRPVAPWAFAAFAGSELQWVFNRSRLDRAPRGSGAHMVVSLSAAGPYMALSRTELREHFVPLVERALPASRAARLLHFTAIKEPEATFVPAPGLVRPGPGTPLPNLVLAGAYTATGWPATMESAVRSGLNAARALHVTCGVRHRGTITVQEG
jgi:squalene-associated FAD-dependent desaturase